MLSVDTIDDMSLAYYVVGMIEVSSLYESPEKCGIHFNILIKNTRNPFGTP